jgi:hypothetical protein
MGLSETEILRTIEASLGEKRTAMMKANACSKICGMLTAPGRSWEWDEAFEHISQHFHPVAGKPTHTIFQRKYRDSERLKILIRNAAAHPSTVKLTLLTIDGVPSGAPAVQIGRQFRELIGEEDGQVCLRIISEEKGRLITAYPVSMDDL